MLTKYGSLCVYCYMKQLSWMTEYRVSLPLSLSLTASNIPFNSLIRLGYILLLQEKEILFNDFLYYCPTCPQGGRETHYKYVG